MSITLPSEFNLSGTEVFLHGDFNGINVCITECSPSVVVIDWQMTSRHGGKATYGSRYFDVIWFINYILWTPSIPYIFTDPIATIAKSFLKSYFKEANVVTDWESFIRYTKNFFKTKLPFRKQDTHWRTRYLLQRSNVLTQRFIDSLKVTAPGEVDPPINNQIQKDSTL
jgi:hypothetical protein